MVVAVKCLQCLYKEERDFFGRKCDMLMWWKDWEERESKVKREREGACVLIAAPILVNLSSTLPLSSVRKR